MNENTFTVDEKKKIMMKRHIKNHLLDYVLQCAVNIVFTVLLIYLCDGTKYILGIILALAYSLGGIAFSIKTYKKDWVDINIK